MSKIGKRRNGIEHDLHKQDIFFLTLYYLK